MRAHLGLLALALPAIFLWINGSAQAQDQSTTQPVPATSPATPESPAVTGTLSTVVVTSDLDQAREEIAPGIGATEYTETLEQVESVPQGDNAPFQQVLLRMPGVVQDSFGQEHVRGEHADVSYRVNGVLLPDPLNGFGQELDSHIIQSVTLIDGSLPAQFGDRTAGIVDVTTKDGASLSGGELSYYGGTQGTSEPSFEVGGVSGKWDYFFSGSYKQNELGIENPTPSHDALHDLTQQTRGFTYLSYHIDDTSRISLLVNGSYGDFQIPDTAGVAPSFNDQNLPAEPSSQINENQNEQQYYSVLSYQKSAGPLNLQVSGYEQFGQIHFYDDPVGDLQYQGVAGNILYQFVQEGLQADASYKANDQHTLRFGMVADYEIEWQDTNTQVFPIDQTTGNQASILPGDIIDNSRNHATTAGIYVQDEWQITKALTLNYGLRGDIFDANFDNEAQLSPRINAVLKLDDKTTAHAGYSRFFDPPPVQYVSPATVGRFAGTSNDSGTEQDDPPKVERSNYYDVGISRQIIQPWQVNLDAYYKNASNLIDEGQFGQAVILSPFNYKDGEDYGVEFSSTYKQGPLSAFASVAWNAAHGRDIDSQEFLIDPDELAYIQTHYIPLDHQSTYSASGGVSYDITSHDTVYLDVLYASGLRSGFANDMAEPGYYPVNIGYQHVFGTPGTDPVTWKIRFDVLNVFDESYQLRSGTGIGVAAPQYGPRLAFLAGISCDF